MSIKVAEYVRADGSSPYAEWFDDLDVQAAAKVAVAKLRMESGNTPSVKWFGGIGEYRIDWGPGYRIYLAKDGDTYIVLFGGGTKKTQPKDIAKARRCMLNTKPGRKRPARPPSLEGRGDPCH